MKRNKSQMAIVSINDNNEYKDPIQKNEGILTREVIAQIFIGQEENREDEIYSDDDEDEDEEEKEEERRIQIIKEKKIDRNSYFQIQQKNLQARRLWQMISPQSDISVSEITHIADILMNGLWLFQQRSLSIFGNNSLDLEQDIVKFDVLNNEQLLIDNDEQQMSIAGTCGWTMEHMK
ncbi:MAG: hypothetical protein EZS28_036602 [Streblomastix strix]|uniref:Uncharacterized protein n=1 Tax=Streblomastix strix TaxID=222440 RepID=A0A5J4UDC1_9EUKA|nr:MAG: hypothetical protein EZS28_036602 [Streblomastix strix]